MGNVKLETFYPGNEAIQSTKINANNGALETSTAGYNEQNVSREGIDFRQFDKSPMLKARNVVDSGQELTTGTTVGTGARYSSYASYGITQAPIAHNSTGATDTSAGNGTKVPLPGVSSSVDASGVAITGGELIRVNWTTVIWQNIPANGSLADHVTALIDTNTKDGGTGATYPYGSGIGEWCWLIWPRFNTTSSSLLNSDFTDAKTAGLDPNSVKDYFEPGIAPSITNTGIGDFVDFNERRWDHIMVVPSMFLSAGNVSTGPALQLYHTNTVGYSARSSPLALGGPQGRSSSFYIKVPTGITAKTLYGVQLYISGYWRMHGNSAGTGMGGAPDAGMFLENDPCNPSRVNTDGDPIPQYGVSGQLHIERTHINVTVHRDSNG
jgi:hypothetical protein